MHEPEPIVQAVRGRPFRPFQLELGNGETVEVTHPEQIWVMDTEVIIAKPATESQKGTVGGDSIVGLDYVVQLHRATEV